MDAAVAFTASERLDLVGVRAAALSQGAHTTLPESGRLRLVQSINSISSGVSPTVRVIQMRSTGDLPVKDGGSV